MGPVQLDIPFTFPVSGIKGLLKISFSFGNDLGCHSHSIANLVASLSPVPAISKKQFDSIQAEFDFKSGKSALSYYAANYWGAVWDLGNAPIFALFEEAIYERIARDYCSQGKTIIMSDRVGRLEGDVGTPLRPVTPSIVRFAEYLMKVKKVPCVACPVSFNPNYIYGINPTLVQTFIFLMPTVHVYQGKPVKDVAWDTLMVANMPQEPGTFNEIKELMTKRQEVFPIYDARNVLPENIPMYTGHHERHFGEYYVPLLKNSG